MPYSSSTFAPWFATGLFFLSKLVLNMTFVKLFSNSIIISIGISWYSVIKKGYLFIYLYVYTEAKSDTWEIQSILCIFILFSGI